MSAANTNGPGDYLSVDELATMLRCSTRHVRALVANGTLPNPIKLGTLSRWSRATVQTWLDRQAAESVSGVGKAVQAHV